MSAVRCAANLTVVRVGTQYCEAKIGRMTQEKHNRSKMTQEKYGDNTSVLVGGKFKL